MKLEDVKLNKWFWDRLPEGLDRKAMVVWGGDDRRAIANDHDGWPMYRTRNEEGWWRILTTAPPEPPDPELRLPEGWEVGYSNIESGWHYMTVQRSEGHPAGTYNITAQLFVRRRTRAECIEDLQRMIDAVTR